MILADFCYLDPGDRNETDPDPQRCLKLPLTNLLVYDLELGHTFIYHDSSGCIQGEHLVRDSVQKKYFKGAGGRQDRTHFYLHFFIIDLWGVHENVVKKIIHQNCTKIISNK